MEEREVNSCEVKEVKRERVDERGEEKERGKRQGKNRIVYWGK